MGCRRSPFLNMGTTLAVVQSIGIVPCFNEAWKNSVNMGVSSSARGGYKRWTTHGQPMDKRLES